MLPTGGGRDRHRSNAVCVVVAGESGRVPLRDGECRVCDDRDDDHGPVGPQGCAAVAVTVPRGLPEPGPGDGRGLKAPGGLGSRFLQEDVLRLS